MLESVPPSMWFWSVELVRTYHLMRVLVSILLSKRFPCITQTSGGGFFGVRLIRVWNSLPANVVDRRLWVHLSVTLLWHLKQFWVWLIVIALLCIWSECLSCTHLFYGYQQCTLLPVSAMVFLVIFMRYWQAVVYCLPLLVKVLMC